jgi:formylglycine-generating enzyme required for sulfatase activity
MNTKHFLRAVTAILSLAVAVPASAQCTGDIVGDGRVDGADLGTLLAYWGPRTNATFSIASDLDNDGQIDGADLGILLANWGTCPIPVIVPAWATLIEAQPDPAVVTDDGLRQAIVATRFAWRVRDTGTQMEMMLIPPGTFQMGCIMGSNQAECYSWEQPVHTVTLTNAFYIGRYEVTQSQWMATMGSNPSYFQGQPDSGSHPVEQVNWIVIQSYLDANGMRLPTEAEWEFACRAGTQTPFYNGSTDDSSVDSLAWYLLNSGSQTHAVGGKSGNGFGLHDMLGNVLEWVNDWTGTYPSGAQTNPRGPVIALDRVIRGGSWALDTNWMRSSIRGGLSPSLMSYSVGFRVARNP